MADDVSSKLFSRKVQILVYSYKLKKPFNKMLKGLEKLHFKLPIKLEPKIPHDFE